MLLELYPRVHRRFTSLPVLGPILDGYAVWLHTQGYSPDRVRQHCCTARRLTRLFQKRGIQSLQALTRERLHACAPADSQEDPDLAVVVRMLGRYFEAETSQFPPRPLSRIDRRVAAYTTYLESVRGFAPSTIAFHRSTVPEFLAHLDYKLGGLVAAQASRAIADGTAGAFSKSQLIGIFYGDFFGWVNLVRLAIQLLVVSRLFKRIGVGGALFVLPLIACGSYALFAFLPLLDAVRFGKILENSTDYSLQNTARHALYLQTSREAKFKAKQAIDSLSWRVGDVLQAGLVFVGARLAFGVRQFALINEVFVILWIVVVFYIYIYREHKRQALVQDVRRRAA